MRRFLDWIKTENITKSQKLIENFYSSAPGLELMMLNINGKDVTKIYLNHSYATSVKLNNLTFIKVVETKDFSKPDFVPLKNEECSNIPKKLEDSQRFIMHQHGV